MLLKAAASCETDPEEASIFNPDGLMQFYYKLSYFAPQAFELWMKHGPFEWGT